MKKALLLLTLVALLTACDDDKKTSPVASTARDHIPSNEEIEWVGTDAVYAADSVGHDLSMIVFSTDWCGWCRQLEQWTFTDSEVVAIVGESFNAIHIDAEQDSGVVYLDRMIECYAFARGVHNVRGYPTTVIVRRGGTEVKRILGFKPWDEYATLLRQARGF